MILNNNFNQVVGVEMVQEAVRDAIKNAEENKVTAGIQFLQISTTYSKNNKYYAPGDQLQVLCWQG